jgi:hypothetical protein
MEVSVIVVVPLLLPNARVHKPGHTAVVISTGCIAASKSAEMGVDKETNAEDDIKA